MDGLDIAADKLDALLARLDAFNPDEPRDESGKWTEGGGTASEGEGVSVEEKIKQMEAEAKQSDAEFMKRVDELRPVAYKYARANRFSPAMIHFKKDSDAEWFNLNGKFYKTAGVAHLGRGTIDLYPGKMTPEQFEPLVAHEVEHHKVQFFLNEQRRELEEIIKSPEYGKRKKGPMLPSGKLRPEYRDKYPAVDAYDRLVGDHYEQLKTEDGVSDYSRDWWAAYKNGKASIEQAWHETLAEMAHNETMLKGEKRLLGPPDEKGEYTKSATGGSENWQNLYAAVNDIWERGHPMVL